MTASVPIQQRDPHLWTADQFLDFTLTRPDEERWQLIDGLPMMMTSPTFRHQRIGKNLIVLLDRALETTRPDLAAYYELGLRIPGREDFNPAPDVVVVPDQVNSERYVDRFFLVGEVISPRTAPR